MDVEDVAEIGLEFSRGQSAVRMNYVQRPPVHHGNRGINGTIRWDNGDGI
jgi:hypothetical protein